MTKNYLLILILTILAGFLISYSWPAVFIILALIIGALFAFKYPEKALLVLIFYLPFQVALNISPGIDLASGRVLILALFGVWLFKSLAEKKIIIAKNIQTFLLLLFLSLAIFSFLQAWDLERAARKFLVFLSIFPLYFLVTSLITPNPSLVRRGKINPPLTKGGLGGVKPISNILNIIFLSAVILSIIGIIQFILQFVIGINPIMDFWKDSVASIFYGRSFGAEVISNPSWLVNIGGVTILRSFSLFPDPHMFSFYLGLIIPILLAFLLVYSNKRNTLNYKILSSLRGARANAVREKATPYQSTGQAPQSHYDSSMIYGAGLPRSATAPLAMTAIKFFLKNKFILFLTFLVLLAAELLTFSRGGYLGMIFGMGAMVILGWRFISFNKKILLGIISAALILFVLFAAQPVLNRFISIADLGEGSNLSRLAIWQEASEVWRDNFFWGVGLGNYSVEIDPAAGYRAPIYAHNAYLDIAAEMGIFALLVWVGLFLVTIIQLFRRSRTVDDNFTRALSLGLCGSLIWFSVHCFFETPIYSPRILATLMIMFGLSAIVVKTSKFKEIQR